MKEGIAKFSDSLCFLFLIPKTLPENDQKIGVVFFGSIFGAADAAFAGLEIPGMYFRFHGLAADAGAPVGLFIPFYGLKDMNMGIGRTKFKTAVGTQLIIPFLCVPVRDMGYDIRYSCTGRASSPMTGLIGVVHILVRLSTGTAISAAVANLVTIRGIYMVVDFRFLTASCTGFPMLGLVIFLLTVTFVTVRNCISASLTGFQTAIGEGVFCVTDTAAAIGAACPVINGIVLPVAAESMAGYCLQITDAADLLMLCFIDVREVTVGVLAGCVDSLGCFCTAIGAENLPTALLYTGCFLQKLSFGPVVRLDLFQLTF